MKNIDERVISSFGSEWRAYNQRYAGSAAELHSIFSDYFHIFPWQCLPPNPTGFDAGCGSGRWARLVSPNVGKLYCIDASSQALDEAKKNLRDLENCLFFNTSIDSMPIEDETMDFGYSIGVLHHVPRVFDALCVCVRKLKIGSPLLVYIYYRFDNKPVWYAWLWKSSELVRYIVSRLPFKVRYNAALIIAAILYLPVARTALIIERLGFNVEGWPLGAYRNRTFYNMRTCALDRFGTTLERRFSKKEIMRMMTDAGLGNIEFSDKRPYWCAVGYRTS